MNWVIEASPNIALIKYWGKKDSLSDIDRNTPLNASISFTLSKAKTRVEVSVADEFSFLIQNRSPTALELEKVLLHRKRVHEVLRARGFVNEKSMAPIRLRSENNFPGSTGMASSASAFAALTIAFVAVELGEAETRRLLMTEPSWLSSLARRGSGSAARSFFAPWAIWEGAEARPIASDWDLFDTVVIFSDEPKRHSSSEGHEACQKSPLLPERLRKLPMRTEEVLKAVLKKSLAKLGPLIEEEALEMHAVAAAGNPPIEYLSTQSHRLIKAMQSQAKRDFYFTMDAGPNIHLISERPILGDVQELLAKNGLTAKIWQDRAGRGPVIG